jgi:hypothetical protein
MNEDKNSMMNRQDRNERYDNKSDRIKRLDRNDTHYQHVPLDTPDTYDHNVDEYDEFIIHSKNNESYVLYICSILIIIIIILVFIIYRVYVKVFKDYPAKNIDLDDIHLKTGDIILFKGYNSLYSAYHGSYFGHVGIICIRNGIPMILEANGVEYMHLQPHHNKKGIFFTPARDRIKKYKGACYVKRLSKPLSKVVELYFYNFIQYCLKKFKYNMSVVSDAIKKKLGIEKLSNKTNCGQLVYLSLIKLGLLPIEAYDEKILYYLDYITDLKYLIDNKYEKPIKIVHHPFAT